MSQAAILRLPVPPRSLELQIFCWVWLRVVQEPTAKPRSPNVQAVRGRKVPKTWCSASPFQTHSDRYMSIERGPEVFVRSCPTWLSEAKVVRIRPGPGTRCTAKMAGSEWPPTVSWVSVLSSQDEIQVCPCAGAALNDPSDTPAGEGPTAVVSEHHGSLGWSVEPPRSIPVPWRCYASSTIKTQHFSGHLY